MDRRVTHESPTFEGDSYPRTASRGALPSLTVLFGVSVQSRIIQSSIPRYNGMDIRVGLVCLLYECNHVGSTVAQEMTRRSILRRAASLLAAMGRITQPVVTIEDAEQRHLSQFLSAMLLIAIVLIVVLFGLRMAYGVSDPLEVTVRILLVAILAIGYGLSRRGRLRAATWIAVALSFVSLFGLTLLDANYDLGPLNYLALAVLFSSLFLSLGEALAIAIAILAALFSLPLIVSNISMTAVVEGPLSLYFTLSIVILLIMLLRVKIEQAHHERLESLVQARTAELEHRARQLALLNQVNGQIAVNLNLEQVLNTTARLIHDQFGFQHVGLLLIDGNPPELAMRASAGEYADRFPPGFRLPWGKGISGGAAANRERLLVGDVQQDARFSPSPIEGIQSELAVPVQLGEEVVGVLDLQSVEPHAFSEDDARLMEILAAELAIAIQNARLYTELEDHNNQLRQAVKDATDGLLHSKERVDLILNNSPEPVILLRSDGTFDTANPSFRDLFGYPIESLYRESPLRLVARESAQDLQSAIDRVIQASESVRLEITARRQDATTFDADLSIAPIMDQGERVGLVCGLRDITSFKEVERMKDEFMATAAHELRTPLTSIRGFSEILLTRELPAERQQQYVQTINEQSMHLGEIVDYMLDIARIEAGRGLNMAPQKVDIGKLITDVIEPFRETSPRHIFSLHNLDDLPTLVADPSRLTQIVVNLVSNAVKYSPDGGPIAISGSVEDGYVAIAVRDEGIGLSPENQEKVFEKFYRVDSSSTALGGTGLGLAICKMVLGAMGGQIAVESQLGEGSTFTFRLPFSNDA